MKIRELTGRRIDSSWWTDVDFCVSDNARLLWMGLCMMSDCEGYTLIDPRFICTRLYPYTARPMSRVKKALAELIDAGLLEPYDAGGRRHGRIAKWRDFVRGVSRSKWKYPRPEGDDPIDDDEPDIIVDETRPRSKKDERKCAEPIPIEQIIEAGASVNTADTRPDWENLMKRFDLEVIVQACKDIAGRNEGVARLEPVLVRCFDIRAQEGGVDVNGLIQRMMRQRNLTNTAEFANSIGITTMELPHWIQHKATDIELASLDKKFPE